MPEQDSTVAIVAIAVTGGVGLAAAVIAALSAHCRQRAALRAEGERLDRQLAHDRLLRDLEELRERIDEVVAMGEAALSAACTARSHFDAGNYGDCERELQQAYECLGQFGFKERRVMLRTGNEHPVIAALTNFRKQVQAFYDLVQDSTSKRNAIPYDLWNSGMAEIAAAQAGVIEAGMASVGSQIEPSSSR
jgi:hypothetical protein